MPTIDRLPGRADGADGLVQLSSKFGPEQVYDLILLCRTARGEGQDPARDALTTLARHLVEAELLRRGHPDPDTAPPNVYGDARAAVAYKLGYTATTRTNFYKILNGGRTPEKRPRRTPFGRAKDIR